MPSMTVKFTSDEVAEALKEAVRAKFPGAHLGEVKFEVSTGSTDRFHYSPPGLRSAEVTVLGTPKVSPSV